MRLLGIQAHFVAIERDIEAVSDANWARGTARFLLRTELELMLATGVPDATGVIGDIRYRLG